MRQAAKAVDSRRKTAGNKRAFGLTPHGSHAVRAAFGPWPGGHSSRGPLPPAACCSGTAPSPAVAPSSPAAHGSRLSTSRCRVRREEERSLRTGAGGRCHDCDNDHGEAAEGHGGGLSLWPRGGLAGPEDEAHPSTTIMRSVPVVTRFPQSCTTGLPPRLSVSKEGWFAMSPFLSPYSGTVNNSGGAPPGSDSVGGGTPGSAAIGGGTPGSAAIGGGTPGSAAETGGGGMLGSACEAGGGGSAGSIPAAAAPKPPEARRPRRSRQRRSAKLSSSGPPSFEASLGLHGGAGRCRCAAPARCTPHGRQRKAWALGQASPLRARRALAEGRAREPRQGV